MPFVALHAVLALAAPLLQDQVVPPPPRLPLPRPAANAPVAEVNQNRVPGGRLAKGTLTLALDVVEAAYRPEGIDDPVVRILALAEPGKTPQVPGLFTLQTTADPNNLVPESNEANNQKNRAINVT